MIIPFYLSHSSSGLEIRTLSDRKIEGLPVVGRRFARYYSSAVIEIDRIAS